MAKQTKTDEAWNSIGAIAVGIESVDIPVKAREAFEYHITTVSNYIRGIREATE